MALLRSLLLLAALQGATAVQSVSAALASTTTSPAAITGSSSASGAGIYIYVASALCPTVCRTYCSAGCLFASVRYPGRTRQQAGEETAAAFFLCSCCTLL